MNYVDLALVVFLCLSVYLGFRRGFLISLLGMLRVIVGIPLSLYVGEAYNQQIFDNYIREYSVNQITQKLSESSEISDFINNLKEIVNTFSFLFKDKADLNLIGSLTPENSAVYLTDNIIQPIVLEIVKLVLIILTFLIFYAITGIIISIAKKSRDKKKIPLHKTNSFFGGVFGLLKAAVVLFAFGALADFIIEVQQDGNEFIKQLDDSVILNFINEFNPIISSLPIK